MEENSDQSRSRSSSPNNESSGESTADRGTDRRRGRGRGRGRGRARGRGRGGRGNNGVGRDRLATEAREQRNAQIQERINNMTEEQLRTIMLTACRRQPSFVFNLLEEDRHHPDPAPQPGQPDWCSCTYCREMPEGERVCCGENSERCHSRLPDFYTIVLDELVLEVAARHRDDVLVQPPDQDYNRGRRHTAYRQYILWRHGYLGAGNRRVVPSCCVWGIRGKYPDPLGQYIGFMPGRLG